MSLTIVATPIGNPGDITLRAIEALENADIVVGEEHRVVSTLLKKIGVTGKEIYLLNEHSKADDVRELLDFAKSKSIALVSDCGTPGFCDPGWQLIKECRNSGIKVTSAPGASSLMTLLSLASEKIETFTFLGFLPQDKEKRGPAIKKLATIKDHIFVMDTPYRMNSFLEELAAAMPARRALIGVDLTSDNEEVYEDTLRNLSQKISKSKREFVLLIYK